MDKSENYEEKVVYNSFLLEERKNSGELKTTRRKKQLWQKFRISFEKKSSPITNEPIIIYLNFNSDKDLPHNQFRQLTKLLFIE